MKEYKNLFYELLYPNVCPFCGSLVREGMCGECEEKVVYVQEPYCKKCGKPVRTEEQEYCFDCEKNRHYFTEGRALFLHKSPVSEAVYAMKYQNRRVYGQFFGRELAEKYNGFMEKRGVELIIPIPLHKSKKRLRGYNQSQIVAGELAKRTGIPMDMTKLTRRKKTKPQKSLDDRQRKANISGAFSLKGELGGKKNILLVDDIYTTGSTLDEAARVLLNGGAENVYFLTISIGQGY